MNTLIYAPDQSSYSMADSENRLGSDVGSIGAYRRNYINGSRFVDVTWQASKAMYAYLAQAYRAFVASGGAPFLCELFLDTANVLETRECRFVHGSFGLTGVRGETYSVKAQFCVTPKPFNADVLPYVNSGDLLRTGLTPETGHYTLTGNAVAFRLSATHMPAATGVYLLGGKSAKLVKSHPPIQPAAGAYVLTGQAVGLLKGKGMTAETGVYNLTGQDVTLTKV